MRPHHRRQRETHRQVPRAGGGGEDIKKVTLCTLYFKVDPSDWTDLKVSYELRREDKRESKGGALGSAAPCQFLYLRYEYIGGGALSQV